MLTACCPICMILETSCCVFWYWYRSVSRVFFSVDKFETALCSCGFSIWSIQPKRLRFANASSISSFPDSQRKAYMNYGHIQRMHVLPLNPVTHASCSILYLLPALFSFTRNIPLEIMFWITDFLCFCSAPWHGVSSVLLKFWENQNFKSGGARGWIQKQLSVCACRFGQMHTDSCKNYRLSVHAWNMPHRGYNTGCTICLKDVLRRAGSLVTARSILSASNLPYNT